MNALDEIKAATAKLGPEEQMEFFRWWTETDAFKQRQLAALKRDIKVGLDELRSGNYKAYDDSNIMQLAEEVSQRGRERLKAKDANKGA